MPSHRPVPKQQTWKPQATAKPRCPGLPWARPLAHWARQGRSPRAIAHRVGTVSTGGQGRGSGEQHWGRGCSPWGPTAAPWAVGTVPGQALQTPQGCSPDPEHAQPQSLLQSPLPFSQKTQGTTRTTKMPPVRSTEPVSLKGRARCRRTGHTTHPARAPGEPPAFGSSCHIKANTESHRTDSRAALTLLHPGSVQWLPRSPSRVFAPARPLLLGIHRDVTSP